MVGCLGSETLDLMRLLRGPENPQTHLLPDPLPVNNPTGNQKDNLVGSYTDCTKKKYNLVD